MTPDDQLDADTRRSFQHEETTMTEQHDSWFVRKFWWLYALLLGVMLFGCLQLAYAQEARTATITFTAPTTRTDGSNITGALSYEVWQGLKGQPKTRVSTITSSATTISTGLLGGNEYCWHVVSVEAGNSSKSAPSNEACKAFAQSGPNVVTITVT